MDLEKAIEQHLVDGGPVPGNRKRFFCFRGFMKSGTNWIASLLNLHPDISCIGELHLHSIYETIQKDLRSLPIMQDSYVRRVIRGNLQGMLRQTLIDLAHPNASVIGERSPVTMHPLVLKDAPQIVVLRDGRDVLVSRFFHLYNYPESSRVFERFPELQPQLAAFKNDPWYFQQHPEKLLVTETMVRESMRWWCDSIQSNRRTMATHTNLQVLQLRYEDVHADADKARRQMYEFLQVDPTIAESIPPELTAGLPTEQPDKFNRKGQVGDWKNYVNQQTKDWINQEAGEELIRQGYIDSLDW